MADLIEKILNELGFPYDDYCVNYIEKELTIINKESIKDEWLYYVRENLFN